MAPPGTIPFVSMGAVDVVMVVVSVLVLVGAGDVSKTLSLLVNNRPKLDVGMIAYVSLVETASIGISMSTVVTTMGSTVPL